MEQLIYERPREKLQYRGTAFLTEAELIQVILGSGTARVSVASLSRKVAKIIKREGLNYADLKAVDGMGHVKACQVLAALELGQRHKGSYGLAGNGAMLRAYTQEERLLLARKCGPAAITCFWLNGSGAKAGYTCYPLIKGKDYSSIVKYLTADALRVSARHVVVCISTRSRGLVPNPSEIALIKNLKSALQYFDIPVSTVYALSRAKHVEWTDEIK